MPICKEYVILIDVKNDSFIHCNTFEITSFYHLNLCFNTIVSEFDNLIKMKINRIVFGNNMVIVI